MRERSSRFRRLKLCLSTPRHPTPRAAERGTGVPPVKYHGQDAHATAELVRLSWAQGTRISARGGENGCAGLKNDLEEDALAE